MPYVIFCHSLTHPCVDRDRLRPEVKKLSRTNHRGFVYAEAHQSFYISIYVITSSTAQGDGGSFKNRKPIGELGCCE